MWGAGEIGKLVAQGMDAMKALRTAAGLCVCLLSFIFITLGFSSKHSTAEGAMRSTRDAVEAESELKGLHVSNVCASLKYPNLIVDKRIIDNAEAFLDEVISKYHLTVNSSFRTRQQQRQLREHYVKNLEEWRRRGSPQGREPIPASPAGKSRHESGFAIDIGGLMKLSFNDWNNILSAGEKYGFKYLLGDWPGEGNGKFDWPHFQADPERFGLTASAAISENSNIQFDSIPGCRPTFHPPSAFVVGHQVAKSETL